MPTFGVWALLAAATALVACRRGPSAAAYCALVSSAALVALMGSRHESLSGGVSVAAMAGLVAVAVFVGSEPRVGTRVGVGHSVRVYATAPSGDGVGTSMTGN